MSRIKVEDIPGTTRVVSPLYREADGEVRKQAARLARKRCECDEIVLCDDIEPDRVIEYDRSLSKKAFPE